MKKSTVIRGAFGIATVALLTLGGCGNKTVTPDSVDPLMGVAKALLTQADEKKDPPHTATREVTLKDGTKATITVTRAGYEENGWTYAATRHLTGRAVVDQPGRPTRAFHLETCDPTTLGNN